MIPTGTPHYWNDAKSHLSKADPVLSDIISRYKGETLKGRGDAYVSLLRSIVGQQISVKAADTIWGRLQNIVIPAQAGIQKKEWIPAFAGMTAEAVIQIKDTDLRAVGLSAQKVKYVRALSEAFISNKLNPMSIAAWEDEAVIEHLIKLPGIGRWTAEMFLIFTLMRPDIFPVKDLGVQKAIKLAYPKKRFLKESQFVTLSKSWAPYRTVATWYLWRSLDPVPVEY